MFNLFKKSNLETEIQRLEVKIDLLQDRVTKLENPFKYNIGDKFVYAIMSERYIVADREYVMRTIQVYNRFSIDAERKSYATGEKRYKLINTLTGKTSYHSEDDLSRFYLEEE